jgi:hypothetical protein
MLGRMNARLTVVAVFVAAALACGKVQMPHELPGPPGAGMRDPRESGPTTMSVAQQMTLKNQGPPKTLEDNDKGGKTWVYLRQSGGQFGEKETAEMFVFDAQGLLVEQKTEVRKMVGK